MLYTRYKLAADLISGKDALEVGCGSGIGLKYLSRFGRRVIGGEIDPALLTLASEHCGGKASVVGLDAHQLPFKDSSFDYVIFYEAIYYLRNALRFVAETRRILRPGGKLIISSVNKDWKGFNRSPHSTWYLNPPELCKALESFGFSVELFSAFESRTKSARESLIEFIRRAAITLNLIPRSMKGKEWLKRLFLGKLVEIPRDLKDGMSEVEPLKTWSSDVQASKIIFAIGSVPRTIAPNQGAISLAEISRRSLLTESGEKFAHQGQANTLRMQYSVFVGEPTENVPKAPEFPLPGLELVVWKPGIGSFRPSKLSIYPFGILSVMHYLRIVHCPDYSVFLVVKDGEPIHYATLVPKYFRYPFMGTTDLQIGPIWTHPNFRGQGIAPVVIRSILTGAHPQERRFWYVTRSDNTASMNVAKKTGLRFVGMALRKARFGSFLLGQFALGNQTD